LPRFKHKVTNYYQNHRRYVKSIDSDQLKGAAKSASDISGGECKPLAVIGDMPVFPCGLIANSVFNGELARAAVLGLNPH
jgi:hypothetical protein